MSYRLVGGNTGPTRVEVAAEIDLAGALAQFGNAAMRQEVAIRITGNFVGNFERQLARHEAARAVEQGSTPRRARRARRVPRVRGSLDLARLIRTFLKERVLACMTRLLGGRPAEALPVLGTNLVLEAKLKAKGRLKCW